MFILRKPIVSISDNCKYLKITDITDYNSQPNEYQINTDPILNSSGRGVRIISVKEPDGSLKLYINTKRINKIKTSLLDNAILIDSPTLENNKNFYISHPVKQVGIYEVRIIFAPFIQITGFTGSSNYSVGNIVVAQGQLDDYFQWLICGLPNPTPPYNVPGDFNYLVPSVVEFDSNFSQVPSVANKVSYFNSDCSIGFRTNFDIDIITCPNATLKDLSRYQSVGANSLPEFANGLNKLIVTDKDSTYEINVNSGFTNQNIEFLKVVRNIKFINIPAPNASYLYKYGECIYNTDGLIYKCIDDVINFSTTSGKWIVISEEDLPYNYVCEKRFISLCKYKSCINKIICQSDDCNCHSLNEKDLQLNILAILDFYLHINIYDDCDIESQLENIDSLFKTLDKICLCQ